MDDARIKVLLIDDHRPFFTLLRALLTSGRLRASVEWVGSYQEGLDEIIHNRHDVYLIDYYLGDGSGTDLVRTARLRGNDAPMIVLTGSVEEEIDMEALDAGATDYLFKGNLDARLLERSIRYALERKRMVDALRESNERYRLIVETSQEGISVTGSDGNLVFANARLAELLGTTVAELENGSLLAYVDEPERLTLLEKMERRRLGIVEQYELAFRRRDGRKIWTLVSANPVRDAVGNYIGSLGMITDITGRHHAEQALKEANERLEMRVADRTHELRRALEKLEQTHVAKCHFFADASHDLRTPLTVVRAELDLLRRREALTATVDESLTTIADQIRRLDLLANDLLLLARLESGGRIDQRMIRLDELLLDCIESLGQMAREKAIAWSVDIADPIEYECQPHAIERAIFNILENALKYSPDTSTIAVVLATEEHQARITIADNGPGITPADVPHVFDRFYRSDRTRHMAGTGLGLSIVKAVVEAHNGAVALESTPEGGTTVHLMLPFMPN
jgi:PAS domain S-box-containing protein